MPETDALIGVLREHGLAAVVSGAGPSILVLGSDPSPRLAPSNWSRSIGHAVELPAAGRRLPGCYSDPHSTEAVA